MMRGRFLTFLAFLTPGLPNHTRGLLGKVLGLLPAISLRWPLLRQQD